MHWLNPEQVQVWCLRHLTMIERILWLMSITAMIMAVASAWHWSVLSSRNTRMSQPQAILALKPQPGDEIWAYAKAYASESHPEQSLKLFYQPENSQHTRLRANTKFAIGNLYFDWAMAHHDVEKGGAHQQQVAMIMLARESYKDALRIDPDFADARFNLELLDRRSPEKRTQGWESGTDGSTLKPFKRNGTAMMRDNQRRGLP